MDFFRLIEQGKSFLNNEHNKNKCEDLNGFYITKRHASWTVAGIIILVMIAFIIGFLFGQRNAIQEFTTKVVNDSFADQVNYSMYSIYGENSATEEDEFESKENASSSEDDKKIKEPASNQENAVIDKKSQIKPSGSTIKHFAQLIGFGTNNRAEQFVNKLQKNGYTVFVVPINSKSSKQNKLITWYQVVTEKFDDLEKLEELVKNIKTIVNLNDIKFATIKE